MSLYEKLKDLEIPTGERENEIPFVVGDININVKRLKREVKPRETLERLGVPSTEIPEKGVYIILKNHGGPINQWPLENWFKTTFPDYKSFLFTARDVIKSGLMASTEYVDLRGVEINPGRSVLVYLVKGN